MSSQIAWCILTHVGAFCRLAASKDVDKPVAADTEFVIKLVSEQSAACLKVP